MRSQSGHDARPGVRNDRLRACSLAETGLPARRAVRSRYMARVDVALVAGGRFHDFDFARLELLKLLAELGDDVRVKVWDNYEDERVTKSDCLVTYTCDVRPSVEAQQAIAHWMAAGRKWFALHGTNAILEFGPPKPVQSPRALPIWMHTLGSQFVAHPKLHAYRVQNVAQDHWFTKGIDDFDSGADEELYLCEYHGRCTPLLTTKFTGMATGFAESEWPKDEPRLVAYTHHHGTGEILYLTLGHCRSKYDMQPFVSEYPKNERGSWEVPQYYELLRRGLRWATGVGPTR